MKIEDAIYVQSSEASLTEHSNHLAALYPAIEKAFSEDIDLSDSSLDFLKNKMNNPLLTAERCTCSFTPESLEEDVTIISDENGSKAFCDKCGLVIKNVNSIVVTDMERSPITDGKTFKELMEQGKHPDQS